MDKLLLSTIYRSVDDRTANALIEGYSVLAEGRLGRFLGTAALGLGLGAGMAQADTPEDYGMPRDYEDLEMDADDSAVCDLDGCWVDDEEGHHRVDSVYDDLIRERRKVAGLPANFDDESPADVYPRQTAGEAAPLEEGRFGRFLGGLALAAGMMAGGAHAAPKGDPMACLASPGYAQKHTELCNSLKPDPQKVAQLKAQKAKSAKHAQVAQKKQNGKSGGVSKAKLRNAWQSPAFQEHVQQLFDKMHAENPGASEQILYEKAAHEAMADVAQGKLSL